MRLHAIVATLVLMSACPKRGAEADPFDTLIARADQAWDARMQDGLEPVQDILDEAFLMRRRDPRVRWRLARLDVTRGILADDSVAAQAAYARARGHGWACLETVSGVAELRRSGQWSEALGRVPESLQPCVSWTGLAWTRWRHAAGVSGALDDEAIQAFVAAMPDDPDGLGVWSSAIAASLYDQSGAPDAFSVAVRAAPNDLVRKVDRLLWVDRVVEPRALQTQGSRLLDRTPDTLEEEGALDHLRRVMRTPLTTRAE